MVALSPTKLWAIEVPAYSKQHYISGTNFICCKSPHREVLFEEPLIGTFKIIGTCTNDDIDFDPTPYGYDDAGFRSLLSANGQHFFNPFSKPTYFDTPNNHLHVARWEDYMTEWQAAENALVKKLLILEKI